MLAHRARAPLAERPRVRVEARPRRGRRRSTIAAAAAVGAPSRGVVILPGLGNAAGDYAAIEGAQLLCVAAAEPVHTSISVSGKPRIDPTASCRDAVVHGISNRSSV